MIVDDLESYIAVLRFQKAIDSYLETFEKNKDSQRIDQSWESVIDSLGECRLYSKRYKEKKKRDLELKAALEAIPELNRMILVSYSEKNQYGWFETIKVFNDEDELADWYSWFIGNKTHIYRVDSIKEIWVSKEISLDDILAH